MVWLVNVISCCFFLIDTRMEGPAGPCVVPFFFCGEGGKEAGTSFERGWGRDVTRFASRSLVLFIVYFGPNCLVYLIHLVLRPS